MLTAISKVRAISRVYCTQAKTREVSRKYTVRADPKTTKIGWIGTGVMGKSMCGHLLASGYECNVYSRTKSKAENLLAKGAKWCDSPASVAKKSDIVFTIVGYPKDVSNVILGEGGVLSSLRSGGIIVDMTTSKPSLAREINDEARKQNKWAIDAPVSGGDIGARNAALAIMVGGDKEAVDTVDPLFKIMGKNIEHLGKAGAGQDTKMVNQILISSIMIGMAEGLLYGYKAGLDLEQVIKVVSTGAAGSWSISNLGPRVLRGDFEPGFFVEHFVKDMSIALEEAERMDLNLPGLKLARSLYQNLVDMGCEKKGTQALQLALAKMNNVEWEAKK